MAVAPERQSTTAEHEAALQQRLAALEAQLPPQWRQHRRQQQLDAALGAAAAAGDVAALLGALREGADAGSREQRSGFYSITVRFCGAAGGTVSMVVPVEYSSAPTSGAEPPRDSPS